MKNAINFLHPSNTIILSNDGQLLIKMNNEWVETPAKLIKSELKAPSNDEGENGDYYAEYYRKYNYILYSDDFSKDVWNKNNCSVVKEPSLVFPYTPSSKLIASESNSKHNLNYYFYNELRQTFNFSVYVHKNDATNIMISLSDQNNEYGYKAKADLIENTINGFKYGSNQNDIIEPSCSLIQITEDITRISITARFNTTLILNASIGLLDQNNNEVFTPVNNTFGLFINGVQLVKSNKMEDYISTDDSYSTIISLKNLYNKQNSEWKIIRNNVYYSLSKPSSNKGINGDIACVASLLKLYPMIKLGDGSNIAIKETGDIYYNPINCRYYVKTSNNEYSLMLKENTSLSKRYASIAMTLNQQTYQTYTKYRPTHFSYKKGFNTGGNYNF